jgi:hypothetical protein
VSTDVATINSTGTTLKVSQLQASLVAQKITANAGTTSNAAARSDDASLGPLGFFLADEQALQAAGAEFLTRYRTYLESL